MKNLSYLFSVFVITIALAVFTNCNPQKKTAGAYSHKTECIGANNLDGTQTVKAWGTGRNRIQAVKRAKKNAVRDVLFNGITEGGQDCEKRPVVAEVNAHRKYESYFNIFFADDGDYEDYVSARDERIRFKFLRNRRWGRSSITNSVIVTVYRYELRQKMIADGIINIE